MKNIQDEIQQILREYDLPLHGFCPFQAVENHLLPCRAAARLPENARTVLVTLFPYRFADEGPRNLSRYAACLPDYHKAAGEKLNRAAAALMETFPPHRFEAFVDNSPLPEVRTAALAGLVCVGDNGVLIHPEFGSWVFIGAIVTDLELSLPIPGPIEECLHCGACSAACPSSCVGLTGEERRRRCLSAVSQKKGFLSAEEEELLRGSPLVWGCDRCQEVCPLNRKTRIAPHPSFVGYQGWLSEDDLEHLEGKAYGWRGKRVLERNLELQNKASQAAD